LIHLVTPVGLAHLRRIAGTVAALLKQAQAVEVSAADPSAVVGMDEVFLSETPADASQPSVTTSVRDAKSGALDAKEHDATRYGRGSSRPSGRRASPSV